MQTKAMDLIKVSYSITEEGHKFDEKKSLAKAKYHDDMSKARKGLRMDKASKGRSDYSGEGSGINQFIEEVSRNKAMSLATKHAKKENSYNLLSGLTDNSFEKNKAEYSEAKQITQ